MIDKARQLYRLIGPRFFLALAAHVLPLAAIEVTTLLLLRWLLLLLYTLAGDGSTYGVWPRALRSGEARIDIGVLAAAIGLFLVMRVFALGWIGRSIFRRTLAEQVRLTDGLLRTYLGQPHERQVISDRSEQRQTMFVSATALVHQLLLPAAQLLVDGLVMLALLCVLMWIEPVATLTVIIWLGMIYAGQAWLTHRRSFAHGQARWAALNRMRRISDGALGDIRSIKLSASEAAFVRLFEDAATDHARAVADEHALGQGPAHARELVLISAIGVLTLVLLLQGSSGATLAHGLTIFAAASVRLLPALQRSVTMLQKINAHAPDLARIIADRALPVERLDDRPDDATGPLFSRSIDLDTVSLTFDGASAPVIDGVTLSIMPGDRIELSGPSGGGKSTLILLICGLIRPSSGHIRVDGEEGDLLNRMRRSDVALVAQDPFIFAASLVENLAFPRPAESLDRSHAARVLLDLGLPASLDDPRSETVQRLSGGERQRLAIARAICRKPDLLILDEATSQLDPEMEAQVCACIQRECPGTTIIMVAHRPLPAVLGSRRYRLDGGRLNALDCGHAAKG